MGAYRCVGLKQAAASVRSEAENHPIGYAPAAIQALVADELAISALVDQIVGRSLGGGNFHGVELAACPVFLDLGAILGSDGDLRLKIRITAWDGRRLRHFRHGLQIGWFGMLFLLRPG